MVTPAPPRAPKEKETQYRAFVAWVAMPDRPRTIAAFVRTGIAPKTSALRWRLKWSWDARAAAFDQQSVGFCAPPTIVSTPASTFLTDDPIARVRDKARANLESVFDAVLKIAIGEPGKPAQKPHLQLLACQVALDVAGVVKMRRVEENPKDAMETARLMSERVVDGLSGEKLDALIGALDGVEGGTDTP